MPRPKPRRGPQIQAERPLAEAPARVLSDSAFAQAFDRVWTELFTTRVHLDSLLAKQTPSIKSVLAQIIPAILLRPVSLAEAAGVGVLPGEPWSLQGRDLAAWPAARQIAARLKESLSGGILKSVPVEADFPPVILNEWRKDYGDGAVAGLVAALGREAPLSVRASLRVGAKEVARSFKEDLKVPVSVKVSEFSPVGVRLGAYAPILKSEHFTSGAFEIQDEGSQLMGLVAFFPEIFGSLLSAEPSSLSGAVPSGPLPAVNFKTVIDACAGAGGKALAFADWMRGRGRIFAYDTSPTKLAALLRRATRGGFNNIQTKALPSGAESEALAQYKGGADLVLVDAPCSGWGVLRRNPDIKWRYSSEEVQRMPELQARLLEVYSELVKPGGRLAFGVCTQRRAETRDVVEAFSRKHPEFVPGVGGFLGPGPSDGFFVQVFTRQAGGP